MTGLKTLERRVISWLLSDDTGASSTSICAHMLGEPSEGYAPSDCSDLGRCLRLLDLVPDWAPRLHEMAAYGPDWKGLLEQWDQIVHLYHNEGGVPYSERPRSPETYRAMKLAIAEGYRNDPNYECGFGGDGTLMWSRKIACETEEDDLED
jgi:hypothetical protein